MLKLWNIRILASLYGILGARTRHYFQNTQGFIFVVDSNDRDRVVEVRDDLHKMLNEDELRDTVLLVFANKQDLPNAMNAAEITDKAWSPFSPPASMVHSEHMCNLWGGPP